MSSGARRLLRLQRPLKGLALALTPIALFAAGLQAIAPARSSPPPPASPGRYTIGVYYFPGWRDNQLGGAYPHPWQKLDGYPERIPLAGPYQDGDPAVLRRQLGEMAANGISYVAFDTLFERDGTPLMTSTLDAFRALPADQRNGLRYALLWANHNTIPENPQQFDAIVGYWLRHYLAEPGYLRVDGRPQVFVVSSWYLAQNAKRMGIGVGQLLARAQGLAHAAGLPGIDFIAGLDTVATSADMPLDGYAAISSYGISRGANGGRGHGFRAIDADMQKWWSAMLALRPGMRMVVPMTAGWDHRPWGDSPDPAADRSTATPEQLRDHLAAARAFIDQHRAQTRGLGVICCWNEFGEGTYIEPTRGDGGGRLRAVGATFAPPRGHRPR